MSEHQTIDVEGMTCGSCVAHVSEELRAVDGVLDVSVDLVAGGRSAVTITSERPVDEDAVRAAVAEAGYTVSR